MEYGPVRVQILCFTGVVFIVRSTQSLLGSQEFDPYWFTEDQRAMMTCELTPDVIVAGDGSGDYRTIMEALATVPEKSNSRFVIYVKASMYMENVIVSRNNIVMYGDGNTKTVVSGNLSRIDNPEFAAFQTTTFCKSN